MERIFVRPVLNFLRIQELFKPRKNNDSNERLLDKGSKSDSTAGGISSGISQENAIWSSSTERIFKFDSLETRHVWAYGIGHFFNDLCAATWFNYLLLYLKTINPIDSHDPGYYAGMVMLSGQLADGLATPIVGFLSDKTNSSRFGKRMPWYIVGVTIVAVCFVFLFEGCLFCKWFSTEEDASLKLFYFIFFPSALNVGWAAVQIAHMSLVPSLTTSRVKRDKLNSLRVTFTYVANFCVLAISLILFATISDSITQFQVLAYITVGLGVACSLVFLSIIDEPKLTSDCTRLSKEVEKELERRKKIKDSLGKSKAANQNFEMQRENDHEKLSRMAHEKEKKPSHSTGLVVDAKADWKSWFKMAMFYQYGIAYIGARLCTNVSSSLLYFFLIYSLRVIVIPDGKALEKTPIEIGIFSLVLYIFSMISSLLLKRFFLKFGRKSTMSLGTFCVILASFVEIFVTENYNWIMYGVVAFLGFGQSITLNTSISLINEVIGLNGSSGAFVFGMYSLLDKFASGIALFLILQSDPFEKNDPSFIRLMIVVIPVLASFVSWLMVMFGNAKDYKKIDDKEVIDPKLKRCTLEEEYAK